MVHRVLRITKEGTIRWYILLGRTCHYMKEWTTLVSTTKRQCVSKIPTRRILRNWPNSRPEKTHKNVLLNKYQPCRGVYFDHLKGFPPPETWTGEVEWKRCTLDTNCHCTKLRLTCDTSKRPKRFGLEKEDGWEAIGILTTNMDMLTQIRGSIRSVS